MAYLLWQLSHSPNVVSRLQQELDENLEADEMPGLQLLGRLPYLNAVIKESKYLRFDARVC